MTTELFANEWLNSLSLFAIYLASALVLLYLGKWVFKWSKSKIAVNNELIEKDNLAFSFAYVGYFAGLLAVVGSVLHGDSLGLITDLEDMAIFGILGIILLNLSSIIIDKVNLHARRWNGRYLDDERMIRVVNQKVHTGKTNHLVELVTALVNFTKTRSEHPNLSSLLMHRLREISAHRAHLGRGQEWYNVLGYVEDSCFLHDGQWICLVRRISNVRNFRPKSK